MKKLTIIAFLLIIMSSPFSFAQDLEWHHQDQTYFQFVSGEGYNSTGNKSSPRILIANDLGTNTVKIVLTGDHPVNELIRLYHTWDSSTVILTVKSSKNITKKFEGKYTPEITKAPYVGLTFKGSELINLLKSDGTYSAVIDGTLWSCNFSFTGNMP